MIRKEGKRGLYVFVRTSYLKNMKEVSVEEAFDKFKPESCVFVISVDKSNRPSGMIAAWRTKISRKPPLLAVCLSKNGYTHKLIHESREFVVAVPNKKLEKEVNFFGSTHGNEVDKFKETKIGTEEARHIKSPLIKNATINFECRLWKEIGAGDHTLFIGRILASYLGPGKKILFTVKKVKGKRIFKEL